MYLNIERYCKNSAISVDLFQRHGIMIITKQRLRNKNMINKIILNGKVLEYELQYKKVKNINLRIKPDGSVHVSANKRITQKYINDFLISKSDFILRSIDKFKNVQSQENKQYFKETEIKNHITELCKKVYPYFEARGIGYPKIKFRRMVSRWGSCQTFKGILTFNTNLMYAPPECCEYVVLHEFCHFLKADHSAEFYRELEIVCPKWKDCRKKLREISIHK